jgi:hypothetical protein
MSQYIQWPSTGGTVTVGTIDSVAASVNGAVITAGVLYMQSASATVPGLMNTGSQTIAGSKTFTSALNVGTYPFSSGSPYVRTTLTGAPGSSPGLEFYSGGGGNKIYQFFPDGDVGMSIYSASDGAAMARFYRTYAQILSVTAGELLLIESTGTTVANGLVTIGTAGSIQGKLKLNGATSGYTQIKASATAGSWDLTLPTSAGSAGQVLQTDGAGVTSWASAGGSGTVTSVAMTVPAFLSVSGSPITTSGTLAVSLSGTALPVINGGTGAVSLTSNELVVANGTSALSTISNPGAGRVLVSNTGAAPSFSSTPTLGVAGVTQGSLNIAGSTSGTVSVLVQNAAGTYNFNLPTAAGTSGQPLLSGGGGATAMSFGTLGVAAGGTGATTANAGFNALSPMIAAGDIIYGGVSGAGTRLAANSTGTNKFLRSVSSGNPSWEQVATADLSGTISSSQVVTATFTAPTIQKFTSGSGTYTTPTSPRSPLYIRVRMVGGGGGGGGGGPYSGGTAGGAGGTGGNTTFGSSLLSADGGGGGPATTSSGAGTGGTASLGSGPVGTSTTGGTGGIGLSGLSAVSSIGGSGASSPFGSGGAGGTGGNSGTSGVPYGSGGGGGGCSTAANSIGGGGGGGGGFVDAIITSPSSSYSYAVGAAGSAGSAGTSGAAGGAGGAGYIEVTEYYQ